MRIDAIQSIKYGEMIIPSFYSSQLNVRKIEDTRPKTREIKVRPLEFVTGEGNDMLTYYIGKYLDLDA